MTVSLHDDYFAVVCRERALLQRFEQYFTSAQFFSHFLRHTNGRLHTGHILRGKSALRIVNSRK